MIESTLKIDGMTCAACVARVEKVLLRVPGVLVANINLATEKAYIQHLESVAHTDLQAAIQRAGYASTVVSDVDALASATQTVPQQQADQQEMTAQRISLSLGALVLLSALLTLPLVWPMVGMLVGREWALPATWQWLLATPVQFLGGARFYRGAVKALWIAPLEERVKFWRNANMDVLVVLGTSAAYGLSVYQWLSQLHPAAHTGMVTPHYYFEASASVITLVLLGKWLEARAKHQTLQAIHALQSLVPDTVYVQRLTASGELQTLAIPNSAVQINDVVLVRAGERIPVDGVVEDGVSHVDESMLTGESMPISKAIGQRVTAGTLNVGGALLIIRTSAIGRHTRLAQIIRHVEQAQIQKAPIQRLVDRISAVFVPVVLVLALITLVAWLVVGGLPINRLNTLGWEQAIINAVSVLVIACPCALGLATPTAMMVGTGVAARHGILIKDAQALEHAHAISTIAFDKTGTLTHGQPTLLNVFVAPKAAAAANASDSANATNLSTQVLAYAAALQQPSTHPLAQAVLHAANQKNITLPALQDWRNQIGRGVEGWLARADGASRLSRQKIALGSTRWMQELQVDLGSLHEQVQQARAHTLAWLIAWPPLPVTAGSATDLASGVQSASAAPQLLGLFVFGDAIKEEAYTAIQQLQQRQIECVLMSGDLQATAEAVAQQLGIQEVYAEVLPEDKAKLLNQLKHRASPAPLRVSQPPVIAMVGDGINDAPALAAADIGIAIAPLEGGNDIAMHTAGVTLMRGDLRMLAQTIDISRATFRKIRQNLFWAFAYNLIGIPLAMLGLLNPMFAGAAMALSSVTVVGNALLLKRWRAKP